MPSTIIVSNLSGEMRIEDHCVGDKVLYTEIISGETVVATHIPNKPKEGQMTVRIGERISVVPMSSAKPQALR